MGKLHTLRRAIERNPAEFFSKQNGYIHGAKFNKWGTHRNNWKPYKSEPSYRAFVRYVLLLLGYTEHKRLPYHIVEYRESRR